MEKNHPLVIFVLNGQRYALYLHAVERIIHAVEVTPLPKTPEIVLGVINVRGQIIPVINIRKRFRLPEREINLADHLILANTPQRTVALVVDEVIGVVELSGHTFTPAERILPRMEYVEGTVKYEGGLILIHNLQTFLNLEEEKALGLALKESAEQGTK